MHRSVVRRVAPPAAAAASLLLILIGPAMPGHAATTTGVLAGRVLDGDRPVAGATVGIWPVADPNLPSPVTTDAAGRFRIAEVPARSWYVVVRFPGGGLVQYHPGQAATATATQVAVVAGETTTITELALPHGSMAGRILTNRGEPAAGAVVGLDDDNPRHPIRTVTREDGSYLLDFLPADTYHAYVIRQDGGGAPTQWWPRVKDKYAGGQLTITVGHRYPLSERFLPLGRMIGTFTGPAGPIPATVVPDNDGMLRQSFGAAGFRAWVYPGDHKLYFESDDRNHFQWATGAVNEADAEVFHVRENAVVRHDEQTIPAGTLAGRVFDHTGSPFPGAEVTLVGDSTSYLTTDEAGQWSADVPPGDYRVNVRSGNLVVLSEPVTVRSGETATVDTTFPQPGDLTVTATVDGVPLAAFCAYAYAEGGSDASNCTEEGAVRFEGLNPGAYLVQANPPFDYIRVGTAQAVVTAGQAATVEVAVPAR